MLKLNLQMFADEGNMGGGSMGDAGSAAGAAGQGYQPGGAAGQTGQTLPPFEELITGVYKDEYEATVGPRVEAALSQRFSGKRDWEAEKRGYRKLMTELGNQFHVDPGDIEAIYQHVTDDLRLYQEEADKTGHSPEMVREMHRLRAEVERAQKAEQEAQQENIMDRHAMKMTAEAVELKKQFPDFDLMKELKNPRFARMTSPGVGISLEDAYYAIHGKEIQRQTMNYTARQAGARIAASVQAGAARPMENGMQGGAPVQMGVDILKMDRKSRDAYRQRIKRGEPINFVDKL